MKRESLIIHFLHVQVRVILCVSGSWQQRDECKSNIGPHSAATCWWLLVDPSISR